MENHPIPQDVTGFQFLLIGQMTVKQFAYLAVGCIFAWLSFISQFPGFIKFPLALLFGGTGAALAFLPLEGRPMDVMMMLFFKAVAAPNQYLFHKTGGMLTPYIPHTPQNKKPVATMQENTHAQRDKLKALLGATTNKPLSKLDEREMIFFTTLGAGFPTPAPQEQPMVTIPQPLSTPAPQPVMQAVMPTVQPQPAEPAHPTVQPVATPKPAVVQATQEQKEALEKEAALIKRELEEAKKEAQTGATPQEAEDAHIKVSTLEQELQQTLLQKQDLEQELMSLRQKLETQKQTVVKPVQGELNKDEVKRVHQIPKGGEKSVGLPFVPDVPNIIIGIIKDPRGNVLPNVLIEVKDKDDNPVRAFKTNALGQFASATPLLNGTYTIWLEDPTGKNTFDVIEFSADGTIMQPLEIISSDAREDLRKALFSN